MVKTHGKLDFSQLAKQWEVEKRKLTTLVANDALQEVRQNFKDEGFTDKVLSKWRPRKNNADPGRALLVKTGKLLRSFRTEVKGMTIKIMTNIPYAGYHQTGTDRMPKRQFMGESQRLNAKIADRVKKSLSNVFGK